MVPSWKARARPEGAQRRRRSAARLPTDGRPPYPVRGRTWCPTPPSGPCWRWKWAVWEGRWPTRAPGHRWWSGSSTSRWWVASRPLEGQESKREPRSEAGSGLTDGRSVLEDVVDGEPLLPQRPTLHDAPALVRRAQQDLKRTRATRRFKARKRKTEGLLLDSPEGRRRFDNN